MDDAYLFLDGGCTFESFHQNSYMCVPWGQAAIPPSILKMLNCLYEYSPGEIFA